MQAKRTMLAVVALVALVALAGCTANTGDASPTPGGNATACAFPTTVTDATGTSVTLDEQPERVVALQPSDAQVMWEIGAQSQVVGMPVGPTTGYLSGSDNRTDIKNDDGTVNVEQVVGLEPDLVLAANVTRQSTIEQLRSADVPVYNYGLTTSVEDIIDNTQLTGQLVGECRAANETATEFSQQVQQVEDAVADSERPDALYYFYNFTTGPGTHIHSVLEAAGMDNVAAEYNITGYAQLNEEVVAEANPDWIIYPAGSPPPERAPWSDTTAVQQGQTIELNNNYISQPGPRVFDALRTIADRVHPDAFDDESAAIAGPAAAVQPAAPPA